MTASRMPEAASLVRGIRAALDRVIDPEIRKPVTELGMIGEITVHGTLASIQLKLTIVGCPAAGAIERDVAAAAETVEGVETVDVRVSVMSRQERDALTERLRGGRPKSQQFGPESLTRIYAITSGKGGVGKSTITANLAVSLASRGLSVGLIDADVFGFSIPGLFGMADARPTKVGEMILPPVAYGVKVISIGMFLPQRAAGEQNSAVSWRGPMLHRMLSQFLSDVHFGDLDILLIDMPPGTGDIAISLGQLLPQAEVIVVTTPQATAADVAERSALVARQTGQRVIGVIENMAGLVQEAGRVIDVFGTGGGLALAERLEVPLLASLPLSIPLREGGDAGTPAVIARSSDPAVAGIIAVAMGLSVRERGLTGRQLGLSVS